MASKAEARSPIEGRWRITSMKMWSQAVVDAEVEGFIEFKRHGLGSFQFAYVSGDINYRNGTRNGKPSVEWSWDGNDEMDRVSGRGWAVTEGDKIHGAIAIQHGDESEFEAIRKEQTKTTKKLEKPVGNARAKKAKSTDRLFQFKVTLLEIKPAIWRRIQIPDCTLPDLHEYIQAAFGWWNYHLHQFQIAGTTYMEPDPDGDDWGMEFEDERGVLLSKLLPKSAKRTRWVYEYDFGDSWRHEVLFEGFPAADPKAKYPLCLEGARACPPEDCGRWPSYVNYLEAISNPKHAEHRDMLRWRGPFDPDAFDAKKATREMRKVK